MDSTETKWSDPLRRGDLYGTPFEARLRRVSFDRPTDFGKYNEAIAFLKWMQENGFEFECCTSIDIHQEPGLLDHYDLFVSVGHDEYWSFEMRDHVEHFIDSGGNAAFFGGNVCWWQIRFEDDDRAIVCYKDASEDPLAAGDDKSRVTVNWGDPPIKRPSNSLTGVNFHQGAGAWGCLDSMNEKAYEVLFADHWAFDGTGLSDGDAFGNGERIVGYETDGVKLTDAEGWRVPLDDDGNLSDFVILAFADLTDWHADTCGQPGIATMGLFRRTGTVFTAASIGWANGLKGHSKSKTHRITGNVLKRLGSRGTGAEWVSAGYAIGVRCMTGLPFDERLFAVTHDNQLWLRLSTGQKIPWTAVNAAPVDNIRAIAGADHTADGGGVKLFAATEDNRLLWRDPTGDDADWTDIGHAIAVTAMAFASGKLFAATSDNKLWWRDPVGREIDWEQVGHANDVVAMTATGDLLFAITADGVLWTRLAVGKEIEWTALGDTPGIVAFAVSRNHFFAATGDDQLLWR